MFSCLVRGVADELVQLRCDSDFSFFICGLDCLLWASKLDVFRASAYGVEVSDAP